jgi:hypothetical protein
MALTPLSRVQQATVLALVEARRLDVVPADLARATSFVRQADERLNQLPLLTSLVVRYGIAYDACHDTGEALLAAYGFRTTNGPGQHEALGRYLRAVFDKPPGERAAREFDRLRRARNQDRYEAKPVGAAETEKAERSPGRFSTTPSPGGSRDDPPVRRAVRNKSGRCDLARWDRRDGGRGDPCGAVVHFLQHLALYAPSGGRLRA